MEDGLFIGYMSFRIVGLKIKVDRNDKDFSCGMHLSIEVVLFVYSDFSMAKLVFSWGIRYD